MDSIYTTEVTNIVNSLISNQLWKVVIIFILIYIIINIIKSIAIMVFNYIIFMSDIYGIGSYVEYKGKRGFIRQRGIRKIAIELENESKNMYINTSNYSDLILLVPIDNAGNKNNSKKN